MKSVLYHVSTIIFDLGGVILDLDVQNSLRLFSRYAGLAETEVMERFTNAAWPQAFEKGEISPAVFRDQVRNSLGTNLTDAQIDEAWNAMLGNLPPARLELLQNLRKKHQIMVLSNTNAIHVAAFDRQVAAITGGKKITDLVDKVYYSHELGSRKPEPEIYRMVVVKNNLVPANTLFIDDMQENIDTAALLGLQTIHFTGEESLTEIFSDG